MAKEIDNLLEQVKEIMKAHHAEYDDKANNEYSIFKVLDVWHDESTMCLILADLLNPKGQHNTGTYFLKKFLEQMAPDRFIPETDLEKTIIDWEYEFTIDETDRRMDIYVHNETLKFGFPIEMKIWANDREGQCCDYYRYARQHNGKSCIVYLTLDGHMPSEISINNHGKAISKNEIIALSFDTNLRRIIESALNEDIASDSLKTILKQYLEALIHCDNRKEGNNIMDKATYELIKGNPDYINAAFQIQDSMKYLYADILVEVFKEFHKQMTEPNIYGHTLIDSFKYPLVATNNDFDYLKKFCLDYVDETTETESVYYAYQFEGLHPSNIRYSLAPNTLPTDINVGLVLFVDKTGYLKLAVYLYSMVNHDFITTKVLYNLNDSNLSSYFDLHSMDHETCFIKVEKVPNVACCPCFKPFDLKARELIKAEKRAELVKKILSFINDEFLRALWKR